MNYPSIRIEGAILSPDILDRLEEAPGQRPSDFGLDQGISGGVSALFEHFLFQN